jgi:hypothetical protein
VPVALLAVTLGSLAVAAYALRWLLLPAWSGAPARLAEAVLGIAVLVVVSELAGSVDAFRRWTLVPALVVVAAAAAAVGWRRHSATSQAPPVGVRQGAAPVVVAAVAVTVALIDAMNSAFDGLHGGMRSFDTLWYHMPFAADFVQDASLTRLLYVGNGPTTFYPANAELVHAAGILLVGNDVLSPILNIGWLALALLAAWCIGRPTGVAPATTTAAALVAFLPVMGGAEAGTAANDIVALALLLAAVAIVISAPGSGAALFVAALAGGLAVGTRLNLWAPVLALAVLGVLTSASRIRAAAVVAAGMVVGGGFWYVRNLVEVGNPLPWFGLRIGGILTLASTSAPVDCGTTSVAHYLGDPSFVRAYIVPQLQTALGDRWWLVLGVALAGMVAGLASRRRTEVGLAAAAAVSGAAYLVTPASAGGMRAVCFGANTRFATPALALALVVLPLALAPRRRGPLAAVVVLAATMALTIHLSFTVKAVVATIALTGTALVIGLGARRRIPRTASALTAAAVAAVAALAWWHQERIYLQLRYTAGATSFAQPIERIAAVLRGVHGARVAVSGFYENYPFFGLELSNTVAYPAIRSGARFYPYPTCAAWLRALRAGRYDYVVTAREGGGSPPRQAAWTRAAPGAIELAASAPGTRWRGEPWSWQLFRLDRGPGVNTRAACPGGRLGPFDDPRAPPEAGAVARAGQHGRSLDCCHERGQRPTRGDGPGISARHAPTAGRFWTVRP